MSDLKATLELRGSRYGDFKDNAMVTDGLLEVLRERPEWSSLSPSHREAIHMIFHKISRMVCGDPWYDDNAHDIGGYSKCLEDIIKEHNDESN